MTAPRLFRASSGRFGAHLPVTPAVDRSAAGRSCYPFPNSGPCVSGVRPSAERAEKYSRPFTFSEPRSARCTSGMLRASSPPAMTANRGDLGSFVVVSLEHVKHGLSDIQSVLESLDIPVDVVESGRRLRWNAAVVLRIPEHRVPEAMLALGRRGFADVMAYQSSDAEL